MYKAPKVIMYKVPKLMRKVLKVVYQLRAVLAMMATPLSWNSWILWPSFTGKSTVKRRFCLVELRYTGSMIFAVSVTKICVLSIFPYYLRLLTICLLDPP